MLFIANIKKTTVYTGNYTQWRGVEHELYVCLVRLPRTNGVRGHVSSIPQRDHPSIGPATLDGLGGVEQAQGVRVLMHSWQGVHGAVVSPHFVSPYVSVGCLIDDVRYAFV